MKKYIFVFFFIIGIFGLQAQHQITLKSGEKLQGKVESINNEILTFKVKENVLTFKISDIQSIFFVIPSEKSTELLIQGELKGVVTYYFNSNYGDKPDVGAKVLIRPTDTAGNKRNPLAIYITAHLYRQILAYTNNKDDESKYIKILQDINADTKEGFKTIDKNSFQELESFDAPKNHANVITADGNGSFSIKLNPGLYEVIIISKGRTDLTLTEINGKISQDFIQVESGKTKILDKRFGL